MNCDYDDDCMSIEKSENKWKKMGIKKYLQTVQNKLGEQNMKK